MPLSRARALIVLMALAVFVAGCVAPTNAQPSAIRWKESTSSPVAPELARLNDLLADLAERLKPGLVHVRVKRAAAKDDADEPGERRRSSGSGFVIDDRGFIVTNAHVVEEAETIEVRLAGGRRFPAKLVGKDRRVDLALLKIDGAGDLAALPLGDSNRVRVGELVLALGFPLGRGLDGPSFGAVSFGIVSFKGAPLAVAAPGFDFIQTDAAIHPGNSGGPLINVSGQVVGVNSMVARATSVTARSSIGFAIPSNLVKQLVPQLASKGKVEWGWLGVTISEVTDEDAERLKLKEPAGVLIRSVMPGEPADKGGVKANDVIVELGGTRLGAPRDLQRLVSSTPAGTRVRVLVVREGRERELDVTIGIYREAETSK